MHFRTHTKPESIGQSGRWQSPYHDTMIDHDKNVGTVLKALDDLGIADNTFVMYSTDNGPHMNTWPDGAMTPFRNEKNSNWEGAYRVPAFVRWPGQFPANTTLNGIVSHEDWLPTFAAAAGVRPARHPARSIWRRSKSRSKPRRVADDADHFGLLLPFPPVQPAYVGRRARDATDLHGLHLNGPAGPGITTVSLAAQSDSQALQRMVATERAFAAATAEIDEVQTIAPPDYRSKFNKDNNYASQAIPGLGSPIRIDPAFDTPLAASAGTETMVVAGGCFWGVQAVFQHVKGVVSATSGYAGGNAEQSEPSAIIDPTDRSIPPVKITKVIPTAIIPLLDT
jgi:hypothetical protein